MYLSSSENRVVLWFFNKQKASTTRRGYSTRGSMLQMGGDEVYQQCYRHSSSLCCMHSFFVHLLSRIITMWSGQNTDTWKMRWSTSSSTLCIERWSIVSKAQSGRTFADIAEGNERTYLALCRKPFKLLWNATALNLRMPLSLKYLACLLVIVASVGRWCCSLLQKLSNRSHLDQLDSVASRLCLRIGRRNRGYFWHLFLHRNTEEDRSAVSS